MIIGARNSVIVRQPGDTTGGTASADYHHFKIMVGFHYAGATE